ncbi:hypothetical protein QBC42DRAFT_321901 [Cladorrhinum samala]|uniref:NAD-dependent epimerase/dehydratase domain-containing protein n=1 Tax=Cladorrhinum samala TaxID=585594 RepID=A0AAV9H7H6_9PEZI|nr:hypothetical protein QBC42DRAFT_321901 [Cladorrhinum samala]
MSKGTVLITGINGYIAGTTALAFLKAGYSVRGTARSLPSAGPLLSALSEYSDRLSVVQVPDITAPDAFDKAVRGVSFIAHLASPIAAAFTDVAEVMTAAVSGSLRVLESAAKEPGVRHLVFMSSLAAVRGSDGYEPGRVYTYTEKDWNVTSEAEVERVGAQAGFPVYEASKTAAERAVWKWKEENKPTFSINAVNPIFVAGPPLVIPTSADAIPNTITSIWAIFAGAPLKESALSHLLPGMLDSYVDVRDVARMIVWGVEHPEEADGERYILASCYGPSQSMADILREKYPDRAGIIQKGQPGEGYVLGYGFPEDGESYDSGKARRATGQDWIPWEKTVVDTAESLKGLL